MLLRYVLVCAVLLFYSKDCSGCDFPDFKFTIRFFKNVSGDWIVKAKLDDKKGRPWEVYINKTTSTSMCHQAILLVLKKGQENCTEAVDIPNGFRSLPYRSNKAQTTRNSAKSAPTENTSQIQPTKPPLPNLVHEPISGGSLSLPNFTKLQPAKSRVPQQPPNETQSTPVVKPTTPNEITTDSVQSVQLPANTSKLPPKGYKHLKDQSNYYKFNRNKITWQEARDACQSEGADLVVINSESEALALGNMIVREWTRNWDHWVGVHGMEDRDWLTIHNKTLKDDGYEKWWPGQPDYGPGYAQCVIFKYRSPSEYGFLDLACRYDAISICEFES